MLVFFKDALCVIVTSAWYLYIVQCKDGSLYTGITTDIIKRIKSHNNGRGSKYTRSRLPVELKFLKEYKNRSEASKAEYQTKRLTRKEKLKLINRDKNT